MKRGDTGGIASLATLFIVSATFCLLSTASFGERLVARTVDFQSGKPLSGVPVAIRYNFMENRRARKGEVIEVKSDQEGKATFPDLHLGPGGFSVTAWSMFYGPNELEPTFTPPDEKTGLGNPNYNSLPNEITIKVHRRSFSEILSLIWPGP